MKAIFVRCIVALVLALPAYAAAQPAASVEGVQMPAWRDAYPGVADLKVAVMGCVVNGPGESKHANIGISLPGTFEEPKAPVYVDGKLMVTLKGDNIVPEFLEILRAYVERKYAPAEPAAV